MRASGRRTMLELSPSSECGRCYTSRFTSAGEAASKEFRAEYLAICQNHKLRTLSPLSFADFWTLFLRQQCAIREALVTADPLLFIKLSEKRTPEVLERAFSRRQQVDALGYRARGNPLPCDPVRKIQRIPSRGR